MRASLCSCLMPLVLLMLVACSPKHDEQAAVPAPAATPATATTPAAVAVAAQEERKCTNEPRTDENDKRPRCGGMAVAAPSHAYRITLDNGESFTACDITKPFSGKVGRGMITLSFTPADAMSGKVAWHFAGGGGVADIAYDYALDGPGEK